MSGEDAGRSAAPARRRDDLIDSAALLGIVRFLMTRPTTDQICQQLALDVLVRHSPRKVLITLFGPDGSLHVVGEFGLESDETQALRPLSLWEPQPLADAVRTGEPVVVSSSEEAVVYPSILGTGGSFSPVAVWPLSLPSQRVGAMQLVLAKNPDLAALRADLTGVTAVLALYLSLLTSIASSPDQAIALLGATDAESTFPMGDLARLAHSGSARRPAPTHLTERQDDILQLMARGMTNAQIAKRIGFSESTVRQETMVLYRFFGVGGRQEAVRQAAERGMLAAPATSP